MELVQAIEPLITEVVIVPKSENDLNEIFNKIIEQKKKIAHSISFLNLSDSVVDEANFITTVFIDEIMFIKFPSWSLQQLAEYKTNRGGEEFFERLDQTILRYEGEQSSEDLALIELYNLLLALKFTGKYWNDPEKKLVQYREKINQILALEDRLELVNAVDFVPVVNKNKLINPMTFLILTLILIITVVVSFIFNDLSQQQTELWQTIADKYLQGDQS